MRNCLLSRLLHVDSHVDFYLVVVHAGLHCMLCGQVIRATTMLICDQCSRGWHMGCLTPPIARNTSQQMVLSSIAPNKPNVFIHVVRW